MQAEVVKTRLEVDGIGRRNPYGRPVARLSPHAQSRQTLFRVRQAKLFKNQCKQFTRLGFDGQVRLRQPGPDGFVLEPPAAYRRQHDDSRSFVI